MILLNLLRLVKVKITFATRTPDYIDTNLRFATLRIYLVLLIFISLNDLSVNR